MRRDFPERIKMSLWDTLVESFFPWLISHIPTFSTSFNPVLNKRVDPSRQPRDVVCGMLRCLPSMHASDGAPTGSRHRREGNALLTRSLHDVTAHRKQQPSSRCTSGRRTRQRRCVSLSQHHRGRTFRSVSNRARFARLARLRGIEISPWSSAESRRRDSDLEKRPRNVADERDLYASVGR